VKNITMFVLVWVHGAMLGSLVTAIFLWWRLATGRSTVRPYEDVYRLWHRSLTDKGDDE
jgi:hypothetical protein